MTDMNEKMGEAWGDARIKQKDLVGHEFVIISAQYWAPDEELLESRPNIKPSWIAQIIIDGDEAEAWIGGKCMGQMELLVEEKAFPCKVKQVMEGQAYRLDWVASMQDAVPEDSAGTASPTPSSDSPQPTPPRDVGPGVGRSAELLAAAIGKVQEFTKEMGGMKSIEAGMDAGTIPAPFQNLLAFDESGKLVWGLKAAIDEALQAVVDYNIHGVAEDEVPVA